MRDDAICRLWYVHSLETDALARQNVIPIEVGYMNVIPKCLDWTGKYPMYENLPETYAAIDAYLSEIPLEGVCVQVVVTRIYRCDPDAYCQSVHDFGKCAYLATPVGNDKYL